jgi:hypothetical protein
MLGELRALRRACRCYSHLVLTRKQVDALRGIVDDACDEPPPPLGWSGAWGIPVIAVDSDAEVMPKVRELRRRGQYPAFVGMLTGPICYGATLDICSEFRRDIMERIKWPIS